MLHVLGRREVCYVMGHGQWFRLTVKHYTALGYSFKTLNMKRETLNAFFTARTNRLPCTSVVCTVKLCESKFDHLSNKRQ